MHTFWDSFNMGALKVLAIPNEGGTKSFHRLKRVREKVLPYLEGGTFSFHFVVTSSP